MIEQEYKRSNTHRLQKVSELKRELKNRKNYKNALRYKQNKRYRNLDEVLYKEVFLDDTLGMRHDDKKKIF